MENVDFIGDYAALGRNREREFLPQVENEDEGSWSAVKGGGDLKGGFSQTEYVEYDEFLTARSPARQSRNQKLADREPRTIAKYTNPESFRGHQSHCAESKGSGMKSHREVSIFACMVWKLETSGNLKGNFGFFQVRKWVFIGKSEDARKLVKTRYEETSAHFLTVRSFHAD